jgi:hypothetical protein
MVDFRPFLFRRAVIFREVREGMAGHNATERAYRLSIVVTGRP